MIGISGNARSGKDTLYRLLKQIDDKFERFAFADYLKEELDNFTTSNYGISAFTSVSEQKELLRKLMVEHGRIKRIQTQGKYFTDKVEAELKDYILYGYCSEMVPVITDLRYDEYEEDERWWLKEKHKGCLVYIETWDDHLSRYVPPANKEEESNNLKLKADYVLRWNKGDTEENLMKEAKKFYQWYQNSKYGQ